MTTLRTQSASTLPGTRRVVEPEAHLRSAAAGPESGTQSARARTVARPEALPHRSARIPTAWEQLDAPRRIAEAVAKTESPGRVTADAPTRFPARVAALVPSPLDAPRAVARPSERQAEVALGSVEQRALPVRGRPQVDWAHRPWASSLQGISTSRDRPRPWTRPIGTISPERERQSVIVRIRSSRLCQLTGDVDRATGRETGMVMGSGAGARGVRATDIGWSFEHKDRLVFLFGDTDYAETPVGDPYRVDRCDPGVCGLEGAEDPQILRRGLHFSRWESDEALSRHLDVLGTSPECIAFAPKSFDPEQGCIPLDVASDDGLRFRPTRLNHSTLGRSEGAFTGFSDGQDMYAFFTQRAWPIGCRAEGGCGHDFHGAPGGKLVLARSTDDGRNFDELAFVSDTKFLFAAPSVISRSAIPHLPDDVRGRNVVVVFGSGRIERRPPEQGIHAWGESYAYLAVAPLEEIANRTSTVTAHAVLFGPWSGFVEGPQPLAGAAIGTRREDRWVVAQGDRILVIRSDGFVWAHAVGENTIGSAYPIPPQPGASTVPLVATRPEDKHVLVHGERLLIVTESGEVFAHRVTSVVEPAQPLTGARVGNEPGDTWVVVVGNRILVTNRAGEAFAHTISETSIGRRVKLAVDPDERVVAGAVGVAGWPTPASSPDRWVVAVYDKLLRITGQGNCFVHDIYPTRVGKPQPMGKMSPVARNPDNRWLLVVGPQNDPNRIHRLIVIGYSLTSWRYFRSLDASGKPVWTDDERLAGPLPPTLSDESDVHKSLGYFSVRFIDVLGKWVMVYVSNIEDERQTWGVYARTATFPWGPWSDPVPVLLLPQGFCEFIHVAEPTPTERPRFSTERDQPVSRFHTERDQPRCLPNPFHDGSRHRVTSASTGESVAVLNGGAYYAPFLLPSRYARRLANGHVVLYYTLSTWNPYQTVLMRAELELA